MSIATEVIAQRQTGTDDAFVALADRLRQATVQVRSQGPGGGSGVIWRADGLIITNAHVVHGERAEVEFWDGRILPATVTATDTRRDLAALQVDATDLPAATIGDSDALRVGELVLAVGNPLGLVGAVSLGIIHTLEGVGPGRQRWIQADVTLAPGNSGGPLVTASGAVIGINAMIAGGLGIAVPSNAVQRFLRRQTQRPAIGVTVQPIPVPQDDHQVLGLLVVAVDAQSSAEQAGIFLGDVLLGAKGIPFHAPDDLLNAVSELDLGETVQLDIQRGGVRQTLAVVLLPATPTETVAA